MSSQPNPLVTQELAARPSSASYDGHEGDDEEKANSIDKAGLDGTLTSDQIGVAKVEVFNKVLYGSGRSGKILLWALAVSIGLTMFVYALDQGITTTILTPWATSSFGQHANLAAVSTASTIIRAISKPFLGKMADITSRPTTYVFVLLFYIIGFVVAASAHDFTSYTVGVSFTAIGKSGLDLLSDIIVGDLTPLQWRGFFSAILSLPFLVTVPINGFIIEGLNDDWRWGMGMFAIMIPILLTPAIVTLYYMQHKGKKLGMVTMADKNKEAPVRDADARTYYRLFRNALIEIDFPGLILLGFAFALILLPFTLRKSAAGGWKNPSIIAMLIVGFVILGIFVLFEIYVAPKPLMTRRILRNRAFLAAVVIDIFNQCSSSVRNTYFYSYISVIKPWSDYTLTIFIGVTTMGLCLLGPFTGLIQRYSHRYKTLMLVGAGGKLIGYGLLVVAGANTMTTETGRLLASQLMFCLGSFSVVGARVGSQASVPHDDLATVISLLALWSTLGSSVGAAIASAIWTDKMQAQLALELPNTPAATIKKLYGSITVIQGYSFDSEIRQGVIRAYSKVSGLLAITAVCLAVIPLLATLFMPDYHLGKQQNAVEGKGLDGSIVVPPARAEERADGQNRRWYHTLRDLYRR
ncbi:hypothetical protein I316_07339 [Kwoniella heveanensis BCC8398]|uniref:Major facilitator superfamily (MFS) profile domain-containing protein n=1 Tax=Kwoniella heveanensis BCC8398 TaxID=1296120 RepID=A0A1B9GJ90_9TREE|nr:hypothetical protein I316_07339 [Kwoniella heveanensis BCC8398]